MKFQHPRGRATLEEVRQFANAVREAGGGELIPALLPAIPQDSNSCLIARNLNFDCEVGGINLWWYADKQIIHGYRSWARWANWDGRRYQEVSDWVMHADRDTALKIGRALRLVVIDTDPEYAVASVLLPRQIGKVADAFDNQSSDKAAWDEYHEFVDPRVDNPRPR